MISKGMIAAGASLDYLNHAAPSQGVLKMLIPASIGDAPVLTPEPALTSLDVVESMRRKGATVEEVPIPVYRAGAEGKPRALNNMDCLVGYEPIYSDLDHFKEIHNHASRLVHHMRDYFSDPDNNRIHSAEWQDLKKITQQRWRPPGWFLEPPFSLDLKLTPYHPSFVQSLDAMLMRYSALAGDILSIGRKDWRSLILADFDPPDTNTGLPVMASGDRSHEGRLAVLHALQPPTGNPINWVDDYSRLGVMLGMPPNFIFSSILATRHGPTRKPVRLWTKDAMGYYSNFTSVGVYDRTRFVYPIPYPVNFLLSPIYIAMKTARMRKLGLWHDPTNMQDYISAMSKQGKYCYSVDFSGMDTTMPPHLIRLICDLGIKHGFPQWPLSMMKELIARMGVVTPSFSGTPNSSTWIYGVMSWMSGFKLTSEYDTLFGGATLLASLDALGLNATKRWLNGSFIFAELGDDIIFTSDVPIDSEKFAAVAKEIAGAVLKVEEDTMFLKHMLPLHPTVPKLTRPFSRLIQQTLYNEDRYSGEVGGIRPDAVMRLGLLSRLTKLENHPDFSTLWPDVVELLLKLGFVSRASADYRNALIKGKFGLDVGDTEEIQTYAITNESSMARLVERAKYEPSARALLLLFIESGVQVEENPNHSQVRTMYMNALMHGPSPKDVTALHAACRSWMDRGM